MWAFRKQPHVSYGAYYPLINVTVLQTLNYGACIPLA